MEGISRVDLDKAVQVLRDNLMFEVADKIEKADIIPRLYIATYVQALSNALKDLKDVEDLEDQDATTPKLQIHQITYSKNKLEAVKGVLYNAMQRQDQFCDWDDSKFHNKTKIGKCECEEHYEHTESNTVELTEKEQKKFDRLNETKGHYFACKDFDYKFNPDDQTLKPVYYSDEDTHKWKDEPEWWCEKCCDSNDGDGDFDVSCDMESE